MKTVTSLWVHENLNILWVDEVFLKVFVVPVDLGSNMMCANS